MFPKWRILSTLTLSIGAALIFQTRPAFGDYLQINLVSDIPGLAANTDPNLKNPWGVSFGATTPFWVSDQATGVATLYTGAGVPTGGSPPLVVTIPPTGVVPSGPTGQVFSNIAGAFTLPAPTGPAVPSIFLFDTLAGTIDGWNPGSTGGPNSAEVMATTSGAVYTGLASGNVGAANYLYAANSKGGINVFDSNFTDVTGTTFAGKFVDPSPIANFNAFNVQNIGGSLYVEYAMLTATGAPLPGGYVDKYDLAGNFLQRVATNGALQAPWGITQAPASGFGAFSGDLLIGNFGDGTIHAYSPSGTLLGTLTGANGDPIVNPFLWSLEFGNGGPGFNADTLYFTAGINNERDGLVGSIQVTPEPNLIILVFIGLIGAMPLGLRLRRVGRE